jgi:tRNA(Ile)-lysidine synthase
MALLHVLLDLSQQQGFQVSAAHFNHHLRPTADRDETFVREQCRELGIELLVGGGDVKALAQEAGKGVEDAARTLRYEFLEWAANEVGADAIATAHHRRDSAETVLLNLLRGTGLRGLTGIPPRRGRIVRPMLEVDRGEIDDFVAKNHIPYVEDETNLDTAYTRNKLRLEILPALEDMSPGVTGRLARTALLLRQEDVYLDDLAAQLISGGSLPPGGDPVLRRRAVRLLAEGEGVNLTQRQAEAVLSLPTGGVLDLGNGVQAVNDNGRVSFRRRETVPPPIVLHPGEQTWGRYRVTVGTGPVTAKTLVFSPAKVAGVLTLAAWDGTGRLAVENGRRTVKRLLTDRGVPAWDRLGRPAVYLNGVLAAVLGAGTDWNLRPAPGEEPLAITIENAAETKEE